MAERTRPTPLPADYRWVEAFRPEKRLLRGKYYLRAKRLIDLSIVIGTMPFWLPMMALIYLALLITSPGAPIIFTQDRTGKNGRRFRLYKFRTMVPNAENLKKKYAHLNELQWPDFKIREDPRITKLGKFLRRTSLDELPQVFNILRGDMSVVGPRPTSFGVETYKLWQTERLDVAPGLTGLWQIVGRGTLEFDERLRLDIAYIEHRSIALDLAIIWKTIGSVLKQKDAV
jgi:lipopolysaccharide/colanic/teichoic acid biosynthesis glycosyltransferase